MIFRKEKVKDSPTIIFFADICLLLVVQASPCLLCFEVFHYGEGLPLLSIFFSVFAIDTSRREKEKYPQEPIKAAAQGAL